LTSTKQS